MTYHLCVCRPVADAAFLHAGLDTETYVRLFLSRQQLQWFHQATHAAAAGELLMYTENELHLEENKQKTNKLFMNCKSKRSASLS